MFRSTVTTLLLLLLVTVPATLARAQEAKSDSLGVQFLDPSQQAEPAAGILLSLRERVQTGERILKKLSAASEEDSLVFQNQLASVYTVLLDGLHELCDVALAPEGGAGQQELRAALEFSMRNAGTWIWIELERLERELVRERSNRDSLDPRTRILLEQRISRLTDRYDEYLELNQRNIQNKELLGLPVEEDQSRMRVVLRDRADALSGRIGLSLIRLEDTRALLKDIPDDADLILLETASSRALQHNTESFRIVLGLMDAYELPVANYRAQLVTVTSDVTSGLLERGVAARLFSAWISRIQEWFVESSPRALLKVIIFIAILLAFYFASRLIARTVEKTLDVSKVNVSKLLKRMIVSAVFNLLMLMGVLVALSQMGLSLAPLLAGLGVAGFIIGFALQDTLSNFAAGLMILIYRPYDVGDLVDIGGVFGSVHKMSLVSTTILTIDNQTLVIPNSKIWGDVIKNVTAQNLRRVDMVFGISYSDDIPNAEGLLGAILAEHEKILDEPKPMVRVHTLNESSVDFVVRPWVKTDDYWDVYWDVTREVKMRFDAEGVSIPFPQRDVHLFQEKAAVEGESPDV